jgi:serine palmitoyltransferase
MPTGSPLPSPMALNRPAPSSSFFRKRNVSGTTPPSAASYLSALSQADARARGANSSPTSTPALSLSSSATGSSEDTVLDEMELNNSSGLILPARPPNSNQVFKTLHTEFGHCASEEFRYTSTHTPGESLEAVEQDPPYYILLSTYISYIILICLGHIRDFIGKRVYPSAYSDLMPRDVSRLCFTPPMTTALSSCRIRDTPLSTRTLILSIPGG